ncbi:hypothetical protein N825_36325 [Skermanella stibiiresistens SB22]|uniref:Response regulatory domain-containing protein n=1 Tax=Skermanella stibiiresistens SB22 TaxID=1385369 RepID=W9H6R2_9PROT|nr:response regulator [Skermanella stibiiresistens]EWY40387.1 hypothetical protein N825_36325 [Skermanella stibiiresistens SB22]
MTGQLPDLTIDPDGEIELPAAAPGRVRGLILSVVAAALGLFIALAVHVMVGDGGMIMPASAVSMMAAGPFALSWFAWRRDLPAAWREIVFRCADEVVQANLRILGLTAMMLYVAGVTLVFQAPGSPHVPGMERAEMVMVILQAGALGAWMILLDLLWRRRPCRKRRLWSMAADLVCVTAVLCVGGPAMQVWSFCYLGMALACGMTDGRNGLIAASAAGTAGLAIVSVLTGALADFPLLIVGVGSGLLLLPAVAAFMEASGFGRTTRAPRRSFRILLAENSRYGIRSLRRVLERAGHTLMIAENGDTALDLLHKGGMDVMLLDVHLREPNALDIVRMYRFMRSEDANLPIVGIVPGLTEPVRKRCISAGMNEVLPAPVEEFRLLEAVDRLGAASLSARQALETGVIASISSHPRFSAVAEPSIDEDALDALESLDPDNGFLEDVISVFLTDGAELIDAMVKALNEGDVLSFREHADSLGSSSTHIGAIRLVKLLSRCRDMPTRGFKEEGNQRLLQIQEEFRRVRTALQSHVWTLHHSQYN